LATPHHHIGILSAFKKGNPLGFFDASQHGVFRLMRKSKTAAILV